MCSELVTARSVIHAYLALVLALGHRVGLLLDRDQAMQEGLSAANKALELDDADSTILGFSGCALADLGFAERAMPVLEKAVEQDPSNAQAWAARGAARIAIGEVENGIADLRQGIRVSPLDNRLSIWGSFLAMGLMLDGDTDAAVNAATTACRRDVHNPIARVTLAGAFVAAGQPDQARPAMAEAYRLRPALSTDEIKRLVGLRLFRAMKHRGMIDTSAV